MSGTDIREVHDRLMRDDRDYRNGYEFVLHNRRHFQRSHSRAELMEIAGQVAWEWDPLEERPLTFSLGAAAALLNLAKEMGEVA